MLSTPGVSYSRKPITMYSRGMAHIVQAMKRFGVRRLVCVSSSATEPHFDPEGGFLFERVVQPAIVHSIGRTLYADMRRMELLVMNSQLNWTIVRPSGLFETPTVTEYQTAETYVKGRFTSRADLADCLLRQLSDDRYLRKIVAVATTEAQPSMLQLILREAFHIKLPA